MTIAACNLREVSYAEACAWLPQYGNRLPERHLAFYGILPPTESGMRPASKPIFSPEEKRAIELWAGLNGFADFVKKSALYQVSEGLDHMESFIKSNKGGRECRARARRLHRELAPIMSALGWYETKIAARRAKA